MTIVKEFGTAEYYWINNGTAKIIPMIAFGYKGLYFIYGRRGQGMTECARISMLKPEYLPGAFELTKEEIEQMIKALQDGIWVDMIEHIRYELEICATDMPTPSNDMPMPDYMKLLEGKHDPDIDILEYSYNCDFPIYYSYMEYKGDKSFAPYINLYKGTNKLNPYKDITVWNTYPDNPYFILTLTGRDGDVNYRISMEEPKYIDPDNKLSKRKLKGLIKMLKKWLWDEMVEEVNKYRKENNMSLVNTEMPDYTKLEVK